MVAVSAAYVLQQAPTAFSGEHAREHIERLLEFGPRTTGSAEIVSAGDYILDYLNNLGWSTSDEWHTLAFGDSRLVPARNLIASYGSGPAVVLGGHYDTRVFTDQDTDLQLQQERAFGANDNGSGNGVLLEIARVIAQYYEPQQEIRLVFFDAEDNPGIPPWGSVMGSTLYVENLGTDIRDIEFAVILDMVGDTEQFIPIEDNSLRAAPDIVNGIWDAADALGYGMNITRSASSSHPRYSLQDDHIPFINAGIPSVLLIDFDYPYWHTTHDTLDAISAESLERVGHTLVRFLELRGIIQPK